MVSDPQKGQGSETTKTGKIEPKKKDPFHLSSSDNLGVSLVSKPLNDHNYHAWSLSMKMAIGAKLGFINGKIKRPKEDDEEFEDWQDADYMV